jgi:hypothetical protein
MARYLHPEVEKTLENPVTGEVAELVLVLESGATQAISERVEQFSGEVVSELSGDMLVVRVPERELEEFVQASEIESVSYDGRMQVLTAGNA